MINNKLEMYSWLNVFERSQKSEYFFYVPEAHYSLYPSRSVAPCGD